MKKFIGMIFLFVSSCCFASEITLAGFAFSGDFKTSEKRFPYTFALYQKAQKLGLPKAALSYAVNQRARSVENPNLQFSAPDKMVNLKKSDQALMSVLLLTGETVVVEKYNGYYKTYVHLRGDALIFDYKNQTVVASYPLSTIVFDASTSRPTDAAISNLVKNLIDRDDRNGLINQYVRRLKVAKLPKEGMRTVQVRPAKISDEARALFPKSLRETPRAIEAMVTEHFGSMISAKLGIPVVPPALGHSSGVMSLRLENGDDLQLKVREGDYLFDLTLEKLRKVSLEKTNVGEKIAFGAYLNVHFFEPTLNTSYINATFKNGVAQAIPLDQMEGSDFAGYEAALRGLIFKLADAIDKRGSDWLAKGSVTGNTQSQIEAAADVIAKCR